MKSATLTAQFEAEMDCPKEVVMWNYYDHEHLVGTHYKLYDKARVLAERDNWSLVFRSTRTPSASCWKWKQSSRICRTSAAP